MAKPIAVPGAPIARRKPYIWATWLSKLLGGDHCLWSGWFKAHYQYFKAEKDAESLQEWNRDHSQLMAGRRLELQAAGWQVYGEDQVGFTVIGETADVAGKPDIVAVKDRDVLLVDGKTGRQRDSDIWQVITYLWGIPRSASLVRDLFAGRTVEGEVQYKRGDQRITVDAPTPDQVAHMLRVIQVIAGPNPPQHAPSKWECERCNIHPKDCPHRYQDRPRRPASVEAGF